MSNIAFPTFEQFYRAVYGYKPHDWQARLAREVEATRKGFLPTNLKAQYWFWANPFFLLLQCIL